MRRVRLALLCAIVVNAFVVVSAHASDPEAEETIFGTGGQLPGSNGVLELTPEQVSSRAIKDALIARLLVIGPDTGAAVSPAVPFEGGGRSAEASTATAAQVSFVLKIGSRQQEKSWFCGPAVVQVVSNYSWWSSANVYSQQTIDNNWTHSDYYGFTYLGDEINGMNRASKLPTGFAYMQKHGPTFTDWHSTIVSGVYDWRMPLAAGVIPRKSGATYYLSSWAIVSNGGHYIGLHGYDGLTTTTKSPYVYFFDTAGRYASSTAGSYKQSSFAVYQTMMYNTGDMIY